MIPAINVDQVIYRHYTLNDLLEIISAIGVMLLSKYK